MLRKRHGFSTGPAVTLHLSLFVFHISMWKRQLSIGGLSLPWIESLGRCEKFQAGIILKAVYKGKIGAYVCLKKNLEGWDLNKKVVKNRKLSSLFQITRNPHPKPWAYHEQLTEKRPVTYGSPSHKDSRQALGRASPRKSRHRFLSVFSDTFGYFPLCPTCKPMLNACQHGNFIWVSRHSRSSFKVPSRVTESCRL